MKDYLHIEYLLNKLNSDSLSKEELGELIAEVDREVPGKNLDEYLHVAWEESNHMENGNIRSSDLLINIHKKLHLENLSATEKEPSTQKRFINVRALSLAKYAAIVVVTLGLSFFFQWRTGLESKQSTAYSPINDISVPYGSKSKIILPDGSTVNLNSGSRIRYSSDFHEKREIFMEGEAFFDVKKDTQHPFYVVASELTIKVLGTKFDIKSYPEENIIETTVVSGSVQILKTKSAVKDKEEEIVLLAPNQSAVYYRNQDLLNEKLNETRPYKLKAVEKANPQVTIVHKIKPELYTAWKDNILVFSNEEFKVLIPKLERWYNVKIDNQYPELNTSRLTGRFDLESIDQALDALNIITPFRYKIEKNRVIIYPK